MSLRWLALLVALIVGSGCGDDSPSLLDAEPGVDAGADDVIDAAADAGPDAVPDTAAPDTLITAAPPDLDRSATASFGFHATEPAAFRCALDDQAAAPCASPLTITVGDGAHRLTITAVDAAGNADPAPAVHAWTVDTVPPDTAITAAPPGDDRAFEAGFTFASADGVVYQCARDGGAFAPCTSPHTLTGLDERSHRFAVRAFDAAGNPDPSPATHLWTVDATAPDTDIDGGPEGTVASRTASLAFSSPDSRVTFACALDGEAFAPCVSPHPLADLGEGPHEIAVRARDAAGNEDPSPVTRAWTVDVTPPVLTLHGPDGAIGDATPTFTFTVDDRSAAGAACRVDGGEALACTSPFTTPFLGEGVHTLTVTATDAGGLTASAVASVVVDTFAPVVDLSGPAGAIDGHVDDETPTVSFSAVDTTAVTFRCAVGTTDVACTSPFTTPPLAQGRHSVTVTATDAVGRTTSRRTSFAVDTIDPVLAIDAPTATVTTRTPTLYFRVTDSSLTTLTCRIDEGADAPCRHPFTTPPLADGTHTVTVTATDRVGRTAVASATLSIDATGPQVAFTRTPPPGWPLPSFAFELAVVPLEPGARLQCSLDGGRFTMCTSPHTVEVALGAEHRLAIRGLDSLGNVGPEVATTWTPVGDLVLHYPLDRDPDNHSILAPGYPLEGTPRFGGGHAGGAASFRNGAGIRGSEPVLSARTGYTIALWAVTTGRGTVRLFSNRSAHGGCELAVASELASLVCNGDGVGELGRVETRLQPGVWSSAVIRYAAPGAAVELWVDGWLAGAIPNPSGSDVFTPRQAPVSIGAMPASHYLDDLRVYNRVLGDGELCTELLMGSVVDGRCVVPRAGLRYSYENVNLADHWTIRNAGTWLIFIFGSAPTDNAVGPAVFGDGLTFVARDDRPAVLSGAESVANYEDHSVSLWFRSPAGQGVLLDQRCGPDPVCDGEGGIAVAVDGEALRVCGTTPATGERCTEVGFEPDRWTHLLITSDGVRVDRGVVTERLVVHLDGEIRAAVDFDRAGNVFGQRAVMAMPTGPAGVAIDELAIWPLDVSRRPDTFCRLGLGGTLDDQGSCALPSTPD